MGEGGACGTGAESQAAVHYLDATALHVMVIFKFGLIIDSLLRLTVLIATQACSVVLLAGERICEMVAQPCVPEARSGVPDRHTAIRRRR
jgi:hypothetical protein